MSYYIYKRLVISAFSRHLESVKSAVEAKLRFERFLLDLATTNNKRMYLYSQTWISDILRDRNGGFSLMGVQETAPGKVFSLI